MNLVHSKHQSNFKNDMFPSEEGRNQHAMKFFH